MLGGCCHPLSNVDTTAAFSTITSQDSSAIGGTAFTQTSANTFVAPDHYTWYGFTWYDLYEIGLAAKEEVRPFFYIDGAFPDPPSAFAGFQQIFTGTRREVTIDQIIAAKGERLPTYPTSQKEFRVLFVLMERATKPAYDTAVQRVVDVATQFRQHFYAATGGRGSITTSMTGSSRRRSVRR